MAGAVHLNPKPTSSAQANSGIFQRRPKMVLLWVNVIGLLLVMLVAEVALRAWGFHPGALDMGWTNFQPLERGATLSLRYDFYTDSTGVFKAQTGKDIQGPGIVVNRWGFRGPEFDLEDSTRKRVMLIGDSFTWGANAQPIDSSYADLIRRPDWQVFNFGIPGADPDQYAQIAAQYIPQIKPDVVCLFYYMVNDRMSLPQSVGPFQPRYHLTNIGWLNPFLDGSYIGDAEATYQYCLQRFQIPPTTLFNRLCATTVLSTFVWRGLLRMHWIKAHYPEKIQEPLDAANEKREAGPYSKGYMERISAICAAAHIPLRLFLIPAHNDIAMPSPEVAEQLLGSLQFEMPKDLSIDDYYGRPDGHFNNHGHRKMADCIRATLAPILQ